MKSCLTQLLMGIGLALYATTAAATDLTLHLLGSDTITPQTVKFQCDAEGTKIGLPSGPFSVHYFNGAGNSLAVVPIGGKSLIFANVMAASGARYASGTYIWWEAGGDVVCGLARRKGSIQLSSCQDGTQDRLRPSTELPKQEGNGLHVSGQFSTGFPIKGKLLLQLWPQSGDSSRGLLGSL